VVDGRFVHGAEGCDAVALALQLDLAERLVADRGPGETPRVLAHQHAPRLARGLEPGCRVEDVADEVGVVVGDDHLSGVDAHTHPQFDPEAVLDHRTDRSESALELEPGRHGPLGIVLRHLGHPEHVHHAVADELGDGATAVVDHPLDHGVVSTEGFAHRLGVDALAERGRADEVAEHHRDGLADGLALGSGGRGSADGVAALVTELGLGGELVAAGGARSDQGCRAPGAELCS